MKKDMELLLRWAKEAQAVFEAASEKDFGELRRKEKKAIFNALLETGIDYDLDGDCDGAYLWVNADEVRICFTANSDEGLPQYMAEALEDMRLEVEGNDIDLDGLMAYITGIDAATRIVNLTPHAVTFYAPDGQTVIQTIPSSGVARAAQTREVLGDINGIPVSKTAYGAVDGLPAPEPNTIYVVSVLTAQAAADRDDLYIVDGLVRDSSGAILGCQALAQI